MIEEDFELTLFDRIEVIKKTIKEVGEDNCYVSFSGGKDSTILSKLIDEALPNNQITRVFINTGIEYNAIVDFVHSNMEADKRIIEIKPTQAIKSMLEENGYPFKSKVHSNYMSLLHSGSKSMAVKKYFSRESKMCCPLKLIYQVNNPPFKISSQCCNKLKKIPAHKWERENHKTCAILGIRMAEGGQRATHPSCVIYNKSKHIIKFKPLNPVSEEFENWYIKTRSIQLCKLYYPPYNFTRTGCKGCPYAIDLQHNLDEMDKFFPNERKQCEIIWKPVYGEYRRIGYRLKDKGDK